MNGRPPSDRGEQPFRIVGVSVRLDYPSGGNLETTTGPTTGPLGKHDARSTWLAGFVRSDSRQARASSRLLSLGWTRGAAGARAVSFRFSSLRRRCCAMFAPPCSRSLPSRVVLLIAIANVANLLLMLARRAAASLPYELHWAGASTCFGCSPKAWSWRAAVAQGLRGLVEPPNAHHLVPYGCPWES